MDLLSKPRLLLRLPHLQPYRSHSQTENQGKKFFMKVPDRINVHIETISKLLPGKKEDKKSIGIVPDEINAQFETISKLESYTTSVLNASSNSQRKTVSHQISSTHYYTRVY